MPDDHASRSHKARGKFCSSRVKITVIGDRLTQTQRQLNVTKDESANEMRMASRLWLRNIKKQLQEMNARRRADAIRASGPGGLKEQEATYTEADEKHREFLYAELEGGGFEGEPYDGRDDMWVSEDEDDEVGEDESNPLLRMAFLEKESAKARLAAQSRSEKNKHWARFRTQAQSQAWYGQYDRLMQALLRYEAGRPQTPLKENAGSRDVMCLSWEGRQRTGVPFDEQVTVAEALVERGFMPTAPTIPTLAIAIPVMVMYDILSRRCASLSIQAFTHSWCDLQGIAYEDHFGHSFSGAFDAYIELRHRIQSKMNGYLYKNDLEQYHDICPPCTYKTAEEGDLRHTMLVSVDGNESLKRVRRTREVDYGNGKTAVVTTERPDFRHRPSFLRLEDAEVDEMKDEVSRKDKQAKRTRIAAEPGAEEDEDDDICENDANTSPTAGATLKDQASEGCERKWVNMSPDHKNAWGNFDQNGVFVCACRHGNVLLRCDMVRSGELAKYPLAIVKKLINIFGKGIMCGYDIGCDFSKTANRSAKVGPLVKGNDFEFCCGLFHGYAHNRICQLSWLPIYLRGVGLEDFETCERVFSESNKVAAVTRHASKFHREQWLDRHFERWNSDKFGECSKTIVNNAKQAVGILTDLAPQLAEAMQHLGLTSNKIFEQARADELDFLVSRQKMRPSVTEERQVDYVRSLRKLQKLSEDALQESEHLQGLRWERGDDVARNSKRSAQQRRLEKQHMKKLDEVGAVCRHIDYLEGELKVRERWEPGTPEYERVSKLLDEDQYYRLMDRVEGLVVARLHELSKMNKAGTGVRLRAQIAKALDARGVAIKSAVRKFNAAGARLGREAVDANAAVKYASLGEFELLRLSRHNVAGRVWAKPAFRDAQAMHFKIERAREEIARSKIEARRLVRHMVDWVFVREKVMAKLSADEPLLVPQLQKLMLLRLAHCERHFRRLACLDQIPAFADLWDTGCNLADRIRVQALFDTLRTDSTLPDRGRCRTVDDIREQAEVDAAEETDTLLDILASVVEPVERSEGAEDEI